MIGLFFLVAAMVIAALSVALPVFGVRDHLPFGLSLRVLGAICLALAILGIILLSMGV